MIVRAMSIEDRADELVKRLRSSFVGDVRELQVAVSDALSEAVAQERQACIRDAHELHHHQCFTTKKTFRHMLAAERRKDGLVRLCV
jgi:gamma-glutamyltranspeptidase